MSSYFFLISNPHRYLRSKPSIPEILLKRTERKERKKIDACSLLEFEDWRGPFLPLMNYAGTDLAFWRIDIWGWLELYKSKLLNEKEVYKETLDS